MHRILSLFLFSFFLLPLRAEDPAKTTAQLLADTAGLEAFGSLDEVKFTFNAQVGEMKVSRGWVWWPKENKVKSVADGVTYSRDQLDDKTKEIDAKFINDQYWLTFPFHLVWDEGIQLKLAPDKVKAPIGGTLLSKLTVQYPGGTGYTPGDAYDLYYDNNNVIQEWVYRKGGAAEPTRMSTWQDYEDFQGWKIATNHEGPDGFRVWFTDISVK